MQLQVRNPVGRLVGLTSLMFLTFAAMATALPAVPEAPEVPLDAGLAPGQVQAQAANVQAQVSLPALPALPQPVGVAPVQTVTDAVFARTGTVQLRDATSPLAILAPRGAQGQGAGPAMEPRSYAAQDQAAEMVAAGTLGALATFALKAEPVRRGLFLLALPLYSRLRRSELLDNQVRDRIHKTIEAHPGVSIIQVCRAAKVGWGTAVYHLQRLERDRMIVSRRDGQYRRFYLNGSAPDPGAADPAARVLAHPLAASIAAFVHAHPGAAQKDVCQALAISPPLASKWLGRLLEAGLLTSQREWKLVRYAPTPALEQALLRTAAVPAGSGAGIPA